MKNQPMYIETNAAISSNDYVVVALPVNDHKVVLMMCSGEVELAILLLMFDVFVEIVDISQAKTR
jgi:hypothetical protein